MLMSTVFYLFTALVLTAQVGYMAYSYMGGNTKQARLDEIQQIMDARFNDSDLNRVKTAFNKDLDAVRSVLQSKLTKEQTEQQVRDLLTQVIKEPNNPIAVRAAMEIADEADKGIIKSIQTSLDTKISELKDKVMQLNKGLTVTEAEVYVRGLLEQIFREPNNVVLNTVDQKYGSRLDATATDIKNTSNQIAQIQLALNTDDQTMKDLGLNLNNLSARLDQLQNTSNTSNTAIANVSTDTNTSLAKLQSLVDTHTSGLVTVNSSVSSVQNTTNKATADITNLTNKIATEVTRLDSTIKAINPGLTDAQVRAIINSAVFDTTDKAKKVIDATALYVGRFLSATNLKNASDNDAGLGSLFLGWENGKTYLGNNAYGKQGLAAAVVGHGIHILNTLYAWMGLEVKGNLNVDGEVRAKGDVWGKNLYGETLGANLIRASHISGYESAPGKNDGDLYAGWAGKRVNLGNATTGEEARVYALPPNTVSVSNPMHMLTYWNYVGRHLDGSKPWLGDNGTSLFLGWHTGKTIVGGNQIPYNIEATAGTAPPNTIHMTQPTYFWDNIRTNGSIDGISKVTGNSGQQVPALQLGTDKNVSKAVIIGSGDTWDTVNDPYGETNMENTFKSYLNTVAPFVFVKSPIRSYVNPSSTGIYTNAHIAADGNIRGTGDIFTPSGRLCIGYPNSGSCLTKAKLDRLLALVP